MRKSVKDKDHLKTIRKNARQSWRNKKANEKIQKNLVNFMKLPEHCQHAGSAENRSPGEVVELQQENWRKNLRAIAPMSRMFATMHHVLAKRRNIARQKSLNFQPKKRRKNLRAIAPMRQMPRP